MRKEYLGYKRLAIPIITMALIVSSWMPSMNVGSFIGEHRDGVAIVEMYNSEALAATVDYNKVQKTYNVRVFIDNVNNEIKFTKDSGKPFIALNRTFIPYRVMGEALGAKVDWDNNLRKVTATGNNNKVEMYIGHKTYGVNGNVKQMDVEPFILASEGRTYIPARYITEGLNYTIDFTQKDGQMYVIVFTKNQTEAEQKATLTELVAGKPSKPPVEIKDGRFTEEQVKYVQETAEEFWSNDTINWVREKPNDPEHLEYIKLIKQELGQDAIIHEHLIFWSEHGTYYLVYTPKTNIVHLVNFGMLYDDSLHIRVCGQITGIF